MDSIGQTTGRSVIQETNQESFYLVRLQLYPLIATGQASLMTQSYEKIFWKQWKFTLYHRIPINRPTLSITKDLITPYRRIHRSLIRMSSQTY
jgi:hypothetical protein